MLNLSVPDRDGLQRGKPIERLKTLLASVARFFHAAEWQFDTAASAVIIDEYLTGMDSAGQTELTSAIIGPDPADKAIGRPIGYRDSFFFGVER